MDKVKLKYLTHCNINKINNITNETINYIDIGSVSSDNKVNEIQSILLDESPSRARRRIKTGDTIISTVRTYLKAIAYVSEEMNNYVCSTGFAVFSANNNLTSKYLYYSTLSIKFIDEISKKSVGVSYPAINSSEIGNIKICKPTLKNQELVSNFLDFQLLDIDSLISLKEKQIKLFEEQRQAMITEAVTKGLNPNVKMKDSGVEWIGEIPEHWNLKKLKYISKIKTSNVNKKSTDGEKSVKLCNYTDVYYNDFVSNSIDFMQATATKEQIEKFTLKRDNVLITKDSENPNDIGIPAYVVEDFVDVVCGYHLTVLEPKKSKMLGKYLYYSIVAKNFQEQFHSKANGVTRYGLTLSSIGDSLILEPTIEEQLKIISKLDSTSSDYKSMKEKIKKQIIKLKEYRQSLIHEAVTGKTPIEEMEAYLKEAEKDDD